MEDSLCVFHFLIVSLKVPGNAGSKCMTIFLSIFTFKRERMQVARKSLLSCTLTGMRLYGNYANMSW